LIQEKESLFYFSGNNSEENIFVRIPNLALLVVAGYRDLKSSLETSTPMLFPSYQCYLDPAARLR